MIKVFLVEDEFIVRNGIKNGVDWGKEGLMFVGEASDGELAYPMIEKTEPDILITDIKMPFMDGLELSEIVKKKFPKIKILILSGYGEFEYAQKAIKLGIQDYLLKPVSSVQLLNAIKKIVMRIEEERQEENIKIQYKKNVEENLLKKQQRFISSLLTEDMTMSQILEKSQELYMDLTARFYNMVCFKERKAGAELGQYEYVLQAESMIKRYIESEENIFFYSRETEGMVFLLKGENVEMLEAFTKKVCDRLIDIIRCYPNLEYFGGIGKVVPRLRELKKSFYEANAAFSRRFTVEWNKILSFDEYMSNLSDIKEQTTLNNPLAIGKNMEMLKNFLYTGTKEEIDDFMTENDKVIGKENLNSILFRQYRILNTYVQIITFSESMNYSQEELLEYYGGTDEQLKYVGSSEKERNYLKIIMEKAINLRDRTADRKYANCIMTAKNYIKNNYMQDDISLNKVASHVNMSPSYFSGIFSSEAKITFSEYLTKVRMDKAKELLMCSDLRTSEIGFMVGYKDSHYFNYIFKKTQECTPKEYRLRGKNNA